MRRTSASTSSWVASDAGSEPGSRKLCPSCPVTVRKPTFSLMPQRCTIPRAIWVTCWMSDSAPVVMSPNASSSATRPPSATRILARSSPSERLKRSSSGVERVTPSACPRGMIETLRTGSAPGDEHPDDRVPALVVGDPAPVVLAEHDLALGAEHDLLQRVREVRPRDPLVATPSGQQGCLVRRGWPGRRPPCRAWSVRSARGRRPRRAEPSGCAPRGSTPGPSSRAPARRPGDRSVRGAAAPGRARPAGWSRRARSPPAPESKPSISVRIWLSVCSRSSWPPSEGPPPPRDRPIASSSSMKMIAGAASFACLKRSRTRDAPMPTIASMNSEAEAEKKGTPASPATARASSVLPVPGGPRAARRAGCARRASRTWPGCAGSRPPRPARSPPRRCRPRPRR